MSDPQLARPRPEGQAWPLVPTPISQRSRSSFGQAVLLLLFDAGLAEAFSLLALHVVGRQGLQVQAEALPPGPLALIAAAAFPLIVATCGLYRMERHPSWARQFLAGLRALAWSVGIGMSALFLFARMLTPELRLVLIVYQALLGIWLLGARPLLVALLRRAYAGAAVPLRALLVGSDALALELSRRLEVGRGRAQVVGFADTDGPASPHLRPFYGSDLCDVPDLASRLGAELVVISRTDLPRDEVVRLSDRLVARGMQVKVVWNVFNQLIDSLPFETRGGIPLVPVGSTRLTPVGEWGKRLFDLAGAALGGALILPALLLLALLVRVSSPGPVLYRQLRVGRRGRAFSFYKFRSMRMEGDDSAHRNYVSGLVRNGDAAATGPDGRKIYKLVDDARVTPIGRFLRRTSLDELPQLINVLRGEMSLVGPRPCLPWEYEMYESWQRRRLDVTPGMTGLWQVTGRSFVNFEDMVLLDLYYIANWSFGLDLKLLLRTVPVVMGGKGGL